MAQGRLIRRSIALPAEMQARLEQVLRQHGREVSASDLIREAIRLYLEDQAEQIGSRRHFTRTLQTRLDRLEAALQFHLNVLLCLALTPSGTGTPQQRLQQAIIAARREGATLIAQMRAVRDLPDTPETR